MTSHPVLFCGSHHALFGQNAGNPAAKNNFYRDLINFRLLVAQQLSLHSNQGHTMSLIRYISCQYQEVVVDKITDYETFKEVLSSLPLNQQRQVGARFVANVLDLTDERCMENIQNMSQNNNITPEELEMAYHAVHSIYVSTHPRSGFFELDYSKHAAHLVAEACMTCVAPTFGDYKVHHLAENVAGYCQMARICSSLHQAKGKPDFMKAEEAMNKEIEDQIEILNKYIEEND